MRTVLDGSLVRRLRHRLQLTQRELGASMDWAQQYVSALECGKRLYVYPQTLAKLAQVLGVAMEELVREERQAPHRPEGKG
jgi:transcriptional regulator with XRE-family HTH domain